MLQLNPWMRFGLNPWLVAFALPVSFGLIALRMMTGRPALRAAAEPLREKVAELTGRRSIASTAKPTTRYGRKPPTRSKSRTGGGARRGRRRAKRLAR